MLCSDDGEHTYSYDARNRLVGVDGTITYLFNASNMRVKKTTPAGTVLYGWDNDRIFAEYDDKGDAIQETVYFGSAPVALLKDGNVYRIYADQIDTPRVVTDNANTTLWAWDSKPFGESKPNENVDGDGSTLSYNLRFPGQHYDVETDKHYNFNRDYNPVTGRYVQSDPIGLDGGVSFFSYSNNSPIRFTDLLGKLADDVNTTMNHIIQNFPEIKPEGGWVFGTMAKGTEGYTRVYSGTIVVDVKYHKECLSESEFVRMYFTLLHEAMHSTDGVAIRVLDTDIEFLTGRLSENHQSIYNREAREYWGYPALDNTMWGYQNANPNAIVSGFEVNNLWFQTTPWHCL